MSSESGTKRTTERLTDYTTESHQSYPNNKSLEKFLSRYSRSYSCTTQKVIIKISTISSLRHIFSEKSVAEILLNLYHSPNNSFKRNLLTNIHNPAKQCCKPRHSLGFTDLELKQLHQKQRLPLSTDLPEPAHEGIRKKILQIQGRGQECRVTMNSGGKWEGTDWHLFQQLRKCTMECYIEEPLLFKNYSLQFSRMLQKY